MTFRRHLAPLGAVIRILHHPVTGWVILACSLGLTVAAWIISGTFVKERAADHFQFQAADVTQAIIRRMKEYETVLRGSAGLFAASDSVSRSEWRAYVENLRVGEIFPGIQGVGYSMLIPPSQLTEHVAEVRAGGFPEYSIRPAGERALYTSIIYLEPFSGRNLRAFGYDMFSEPVRRAAMERARDSGLAAMSGMVTLVQETDADVQHGVLMYLPVYRNGASVNTVEERRAALRGYVYSPFRLNDLMYGILGSGVSEIGFQIFDGATPEPQALLYDSSEPANSPDHAADPPEFVATRQIMVTGHLWTLRFFSTQSYLTKAEASQPLVVAVAGALIDLLLFLTIVSITRHRRKAERDAEAKTAFLANMSHEIRTPMNAILGLTECLRRDVHNPDHAARLDKISHSAHHLLGVINSVLDMSKIEAGKMPIVSQDFSLPRVLAGVMDQMVPQAREKGLSLRLETERDLAEFWRGDSLRISQCLINYIGNSVKFTAHGDITVRVTQDGGGTQDAPLIRFEVQDSGPGIEPAALPHLFSAFEQISCTTNRQFGGTGLGLSITKQFAMLMGGNVGVESTPGIGSRFWFTVALQPVAATGLTDLDNATESEVLRRDFTAFRLLLVDDSALNREVLVDLLTSAGLTCDEAENGKQAVETCRRQAYDLILMDVQMPVMDGLTAVKIIRDIPEYARTPIIALTANAFAEDRQRCLDAGMSGYLSKPILSADLYGAILHWLSPPAAPENAAAPCQDDATLDILADIPGLTPEDGLVSMLGPAKYVEYLHDFLAEGRKYLILVEDALEKRDREELHFATHSLKGISGVIGMMGVFNQALAVERVYRENADDEQLWGEAEVLIQALSTTVNALDATLSKLPADLGEPPRQLPAACAIGGGR